MSARRQFRKYLDDLYDTGALKALAEKVWADMNVTMPMWPGHDGECLFTVRVGTQDYGPLIPKMRCMRLRFLQRFSTGDAAMHAESDCFDEYIMEQTAARGLPHDITFEEQLKETLAQEIRDLKDYFIKTVNKDRLDVN